MGKFADFTDKTKGFIEGQEGGIGGIADNVMGVVGQATKMIDDVKTPLGERMDRRGNITHEVDAAGNVMGGAAAGAKAGGMFGPWGQLIGGVAGGIGGGIASILDQNAQPDMLDQDSRYQQFMLENQVSTIRPEAAFAQQQQMAENGLDVKGNTKQIEVERDEIVLRKVGKTFRKVADFKGGKPHEMGGEQFVAEEGDIIFPGKDRRRITNLVNNKRWSAIESARQQLPTDVPTGRAELGFDNTDPIKKKYGQKDVDDINAQGGLSGNMLAQDGGSDVMNRLLKKKYEYDPNNAYLGKYGDSYADAEGFATKGGGMYKTQDGYITPSGNRTYNAADTKNYLKKIAELPENKDRTIMYKDSKGSEPFRQYSKQYAEGTKGIKTGSAGPAKDGIEDKIYSRLRKEGFSEQSALGVIANLAWETDNFTAWEEYKENIYGTKGGGIAMWTNNPWTNRRDMYDSWMKENNKDVLNVDHQLDYLLHEIYNVKENMATGKRFKIDKLKKMDSIAGAADYFMKGFEGPTDQSKEHLQKRLNLIANFTPEKLTEAKSELAQIKKDKPLVTKQDVKGFVKQAKDVVKGIFEAGGNSNKERIKAMQKAGYSEEEIQQAEGPESKSILAEINEAGGNSNKARIKGMQKVASTPYDEDGLNQDLLGRMRRSQKDGLAADKARTSENRRILSDTIKKYIVNDGTKLKILKDILAGGPMGINAASVPTNIIADIYEGEMRKGNIDKSFDEAFPDAEETPAPTNPQNSWEIPSGMSTGDAADALGINSIPERTAHEEQSVIPHIKKAGTIAGYEPTTGSGAELPAGATTSTGEQAVVNAQIGKTTESIKSGASMLGGAFESLAAYAPAIYNLAKGSEKAEKVNRNYVNPMMRSFQDRGQADRNEIDKAFRQSMASARNLSGGSQGNYRSNLEQAWANKIDRNAQVNTREASRADQVAAGNVAAINQADQINTQMENKADIMDMQSQSATDSFMAQGMQDIANIGAVRRKDSQMEANQNMILKYIKSNRPFDTDDLG